MTIGEALKASKSDEQQIYHRTGEDSEHPVCYDQGHLYNSLSADDLMANDWSEQ